MHQSLSTIITSYPSVLGSIGTRQYDAMDTLMQLQDIFYLYKNESEAELTDSEMMDFMRRQFNEICFGDLDYLPGKCLERFARAIRSGYVTQAQSQERDKYALIEVENEYKKWDEETRWKYNAYMQELEDKN